MASALVVTIRLSRWVVPVLKVIGALYALGLVSEARVDRWVHVLARKGTVWRIGDRSEWRRF